MDKFDEIDGENLMYLLSRFFATLEGTASPHSQNGGGVPIETKTLKGLDSLLSIVQMPAGIPVPTVAIGKPGAINAALAAISILGNKYPEIEKKLENFRIKQTKSIKNIPVNE